MLETGIYLEIDTGDQQYLFGKMKINQLNYVLDQFKKCMNTTKNMAQK